MPLPITADTEMAFTRLVAPGLGEGRDFPSLILLAARDAGIAIAPERD